AVDVALGAVLHPVRAPRHARPEDARGAGGTIGGALTRPTRGAGARRAAARRADGAARRLVVPGRGADHRAARACARARAAHPARAAPTVREIEDEVRRARPDQARNDAHDDRDRAPAMHQNLPRTPSEPGPTWTATPALAEPPGRT